MPKKNKGLLHAFVEKIVREALERELEQENPDLDRAVDSIEFSMDVYKKMEKYLGKRIDFMAIS